MIFLFLFYADEAAIAAMSRPERNALVERHIRFNHDVLEKRATVLATRGLDPSFTAKTVRPAGDEMVVTDGPGVEAALSLGGFYLVECRGMDDALDLAKSYPMPEGLGCVEVRPVTSQWEFAPSIDSPAPPEAIWRLYSDAATWPDWKHDIERAELDGPFEAGATGWLRPVGHPPMPFRVVEAAEGAGYVSETELADGVTLRMEHELTPLPDGGTRIVHSVTIPRAALDRFGLEFSPNFNAGMRATLQALSDQAAAEPARR